MPTNQYLEKQYWFRNRFQPLVSYKDDFTSPSPVTIQSSVRELTLEHKDSIKIRTFLPPLAVHFFRFVITGLLFPIDRPFSDQWDKVRC